MKVSLTSRYQPDPSLTTSTDLVINTSTLSPSATPVTNAAVTSSNKNIPEIAGGVGGAIGAIALILLIVFYVVCTQCPWKSFLSHLICSVELVNAKR